MTFRPAQAEALSEKRQTYWDKNHALTCRTLAEDFELGESIQAGMALGVNEAVTFGRFEGALHCFNQSVEAALGRQQAEVMMVSAASRGTAPDRGMQARLPNF